MYHEDNFKLVVEQDTPNRKEVIPTEMQNWLQQHSISLQYEALGHRISGYVLYLIDPIHNIPYIVSPISTFQEDLVEWWSINNEELTLIVDSLVTTSLYYGTSGVTTISTETLSLSRNWLKQFPAII